MFIITFTQEVKDLIGNKFKEAKKAGISNIELSSKEIHDLLGYKERFPIICNTMNQMMTEKDEFLNITPSGQSSTLKIKYYLDDK